MFRNKTKVLSLNLSLYHSSCIYSYNGRAKQHTHLEVLGELLVELVVVVLVLGQIVDQLHALLDQVLADDLEDLALLQHLAGDVEGEVLRVHHALDEVEVLRDDVLAVVHDEDSANVQLDVVLLLLVLKHVEGSALGDEEQSTELQLSLHREVLHKQTHSYKLGRGK